MRDIKYRAWIKPHVDYVGGKMWQVVGMTWREYVDDGEPENPVHNRVFDIDIQDIEEFDKGWSSKTAWQHLEPEDFELIEFTGLKDKNGKEIYESDVVNFKSLEGFDCGYDDETFDRNSDQVREEQRVVTFVDGAFWPREMAVIVDDGFYSYRYFDFEVVGNIYENPDLLTK